PITRPVSVLDGTLGNNYAGEYVENQVTVTWTGTNLAAGFTFTANPGTLATSSVDGGFAELGHERNGAFDPSGGDGAANLVQASSALVSHGGHAAVPRVSLAVAGSTVSATNGPGSELTQVPPKKVSSPNALFGAASSGHAPHSDAVAALFAAIGS